MCPRTSITLAPDPSRHIETVTGEERRRQQPVACSSGHHSAANEAEHCRCRDYLKYWHCSVSTKLSEIKITAICNRQNKQNYLKQKRCGIFITFNKTARLAPTTQPLLQKRHCQLQWWLVNTKNWRWRYLKWMLRPLSTISDTAPESRAWTASPPPCLGCGRGAGRRDTETTGRRAPPVSASAPPPGKAAS